MMFVVLLSCVMLFRIVDLVCGFVFFFFKQKTAYEMRISDWSSDVCSSDLNVAGALLSGLVYFAARPARPDAATMRIHALRSLFVAMKIGRASCRERVCQYV